LLEFNADASTEQSGTFLEKSRGVQGVWVRLEIHVQRRVAQNVELFHEPRK
jgi:hypothetical protein